MSDRLKYTQHVSNEDIIEDITKNLETSLSTEENIGGPVYSPSSSLNKEPEAPENTSEAKDIPASYWDTEYDKDEKDKSESDREDIETDVDEVRLKDEDVTLSDQEKEVRKTTAEEHKRLGNEAYKAGDYELSIKKYTEGLRVCPLKYNHVRSVLYCNRSAAEMKLKLYKRAVNDCTKAIELDDVYIKAYHRRAQSHEAVKNYDESLADFKKLLELDPNSEDAKKAIVRLPPIIAQRNEELKTEMMGKLKDLGNMLLKPFGLSTQNFNLQQDPETKGYKVNFKQN